MIQQTNNVMGEGPRNYNEERMTLLMKAQ
jgi:hypothetical protein